MKTRWTLTGVVFAGVLLSACGSNPEQPSDIEAGAVDTSAPGDENANAQGVVVDGVDEGMPIDPNSIAGRAPQERVIYFDFDDSEVRPEFVDLVTQHGRFLAANPEGRIRLEGHTDERGTREYNIALGEDRAKSIASMLEFQGVQPRQIRVVSYGEELPVDEGHNNEAWAKNRRVNIIYEVGVSN